jgi:hypothetical protein
MITFTLVLVRVGHQPERLTAEMITVPSVHEFVSVGGQLYRVEDITHNVETKGIEVRAVA